MIASTRFLQRVAVRMVVGHDEEKGHDPSCYISRMAIAARTEETLLPS